MSMRLYVANLEKLKEAVESLRAVVGVEVSEFVCEGHRVYVAKDTDGAYYIRGISVLEEKAGPVLRDRLQPGTARN